MYQFCYFLGDFSLVLGDAGFVVVKFGKVTSNGLFEQLPWMLWHLFRVRSASLNLGGVKTFKGHSKKSMKSTITVPFINKNFLTLGLFL
jgi:hypothetical protein